MKLATLCYLKRDSQTLMLQRVKKQNDIHHGKWNGLGGKFEAGESPEECVVREVLEESGLKIENPCLCGFLIFPEFKDAEDWYVFVYTAKQFSGTLIDSSEGHLAWIDNDKLLSLNLWEGDKYFFKWMDEGRFFSAKFYYEDKRLVDHQVTFPIQ